MAPYRLFRYRCLLLPITLGMIFYSLISHDPINPNDCLNHLPLLLQSCVPRSLSFCLVVGLAWTHYFARCGLVTRLLCSVWTLDVDPSLDSLALFLRLNHLPLLLQSCVPRSLSFCSVIGLVWTHYFARCGLVTWLAHSVWTLGVDSSLGSLAFFLLLTFHDCSVVRSLSSLLSSILFWFWCSQRRVSLFGRLVYRYALALASRLSSILFFSVLTASCVAAWSSCVLFWCRCSQRRVSLFGRLVCRFASFRSCVVAQLDPILLGAHSVVCHYLVISCVGPGSLSLFTSLCGLLRFCSITRRLFWSRCSRRCFTRRLYASLTCLYASSCVLGDFYDSTESTECVFPTYTSHPAFDSIVSPPLQSTICFNCRSLTPLSRKRRAASSLSSSSSGTESPCPATRQITSSGFTPVNSVLRSSGTESSSPIVSRKKAGNRQKTAAKEVAKDGTYNPPGYVLFD